MGAWLSKVAEKVIPYATTLAVTTIGTAIGVSIAHPITQWYDRKFGMKPVEKPKTEETK